MRTFLLFARNRGLCLKRQRAAGSIPLAILGDNKLSPCGITAASHGLNIGG